MASLSEQTHKKALGKMKALGWRQRNPIFDGATHHQGLKELASRVFPLQ